MFTETAVRKGVVQRVVSDGVVFYAEDDSVALFVPFDQVDVAKVAADGEREGSTAAARDARMRRWLTQGEAAEYLGVTDRTIRNYITRGDLPARRIKGSRLVRISQSDLDSFLEPA